MILRLTPAHFLLLLVAAIWGSGFVAQRAGMETLGPYSFNAARFVFAFLSLLPLWWYMKQRHQGKPQLQESYSTVFWLGGLLAGSLLFAGFSLQQVGLQYTTAGNAGFITSIYIVIVPLLGLAMGQSTRMNTWIGIIFAVTGLYILSIWPDFQINKGDSLELIGAFFWAAHVVTMGWIAQRIRDSIGFSMLQFIVAACWAIASTVILENPSLADFKAALLPLLYAGFMVSGIAFTLQLIAQRTVNASSAALILSGEAVFALLAGWLFLEETVTVKALIGCSFMLAGLLISQWPKKRLKPKHSGTQ